MAKIEFYRPLRLQKSLILVYMSKNLFLPVGLAFCLLLIFHTSTFALDLTKVDFSYLYKDTNVNFDYQIAEKGGSYKLRIYMKLRKVGPNSDIKNFQIASQRRFNSKKSEPVQVLNDQKSKKEEVIVYDYTFKTVAGDHEYVIVSFDFLTQPYVIDIPIGDALEYPYPEFLIERPSGMMNVTKVGDTLNCEGFGRTGNYHVYLYEDRFETPTPVYADEYADAGAKFIIKDEKTFQDSYQADKANYCYYFQKDNKSTKGRSAYVYPEYFPKNKEYDELIGALRYISTNEEFDKLTEARNKQLAFDNFWLAMIPSKKLAARTLRNFYTRVNLASEMFSDYKAGWKTDRGMMYVVFGPPNEVIKERGREIWIYNNYNGRLSFTFAKIPHQMAGFLYSLERDKKYANVWYGQVDKWRKGSL